MQSGTLHIASSLFFIIPKASSIRKLNLINIFPYGGRFVKNEKEIGKNVQGSTLHPFYIQLFTTTEKSTIV